MAAGQFRAIDSHIAALTVFGMCNWPAWWFNPQGQRDAEEVANAICAMIVGSLQITEKPIATSPLNVLDGIRADINVLEHMFRSGCTLPPDG